MDEKNMSEEQPQSGSRRNFIKGVVAAGAVASSSAYLFRGSTVHGQPAAGAVERLIGERGAERHAPGYTLRPPAPGDLGWVVARHGALYAQERGWGIRFEGLVAEIVAQFVATCDPARERCWIADMDGEPVGCVFVVKASDDAAKLRLLLVEPKARGLGIGARLVDECLRFARAAGYLKMTLWTQSILVEAHRVYEGAGFERVATQPHAEFGHALIGETWERAL